MSIAAELPWLHGPWQRLSAHLNSDRLPQALLISGKAGLGKLRLALAFAQRLLCHHPTDGACDACPSCHLFKAQTHPDLERVEALEFGKPITVDQIRGLIDRLTLKPQYGGYRIVIINPAHAMNIAAANSLLKTLEEPDPHTLMLLLTDAPDLLPATILSRCQRLELQPPTRADALAWLARQGVNRDASALLALAQGAPLRALAMAGQDTFVQRNQFFQSWKAVLEGDIDPLIVAERWQSTDLDSLSQWVVSWILDLIRLHVLPDHNGLENADLFGDLRDLADRLDLKALYHYLDRVFTARRALTSQVNRPLILEELLIYGSRLIT